MSTFGYADGGGELWKFMFQRISTSQGCAATRVTAKTKEDRVAAMHKPKSYADLVEMLNTVDEVLDDFEEVSVEEMDDERPLIAVWRNLDPELADKITETREEGVEMSCTSLRDFATNTNTEVKLMQGLRNAGKGSSSNMDVDHLKDKDDGGDGGDDLDVLGKGNGTGVVCYREWHRSSRKVVPEFETSGIRSVYELWRCRPRHQDAYANMRWQVKPVGYGCCAGGACCGQTKQELGVSGREENSERNAFNEQDKASLEDAGSSDGAGAVAGMVEHTVTVSWASASSVVASASSVNVCCEICTRCSTETISERVLTVSASSWTNTCPSFRSARTPAGPKPLNYPPHGWRRWMPPPPTHTHTHTPPAEAMLLSWGAPVRTDDARLSAASGASNSMATGDAGARYSGAPSAKWLVRDGPSVADGAEASGIDGAGADADAG